MSSRTLGIVCLSPSFGGLELNTLRLAGWMQERGNNVHLLVRENSPLQQKATAAGLNITIVSAAGLLFKDAHALKNWVKTHQLRALFFPFRNDLKVAAFYKRFYNRSIKIIYQQQMQVGISKRDLIHTLRYAMIDAWISPLPYLKAETIAKTRVPAAKIHIIPLCIETKGFEQSHWTREQARAAFSLPPEPKMIGVLGRIDPKKGHDLVIKGIHELHQKYGADFQLLMLGDATLNEGDAFSMHLKKLVRDLNLTDKVHFRGYQPDVMQFFRAIDIFAMPSHGETFGMVTLEAMAAGVPVVGTNTDGTKELLKDGALGYLFPKNDVATFAQQVMAIEQNKSLPGLLRQAQEEVIQHYNKELMCVGIEELLDGLDG